MADPVEVLDGMKIKPVKKYNLIYDSSSETLEPIYFWILDFMNDNFGGKVEKVVDNFTASPGGGYFAEMGQRRSIMQDNVMKTLATVGTVTKSIINLVYDLKDFEIRLKHYDDLKSGNKLEKEGAMLALKQIWLDNVDIKRGVGSIHQMTAGNLNFVTLRDAFLASKTLEEADKLDLNERVKRILKPRLAEFLEWIKVSEEEIRKRFNVEKNYLKSQVNSLQLYSRWVKPYLKAATQLEMKDSSRNPALVTSFNTVILELTLFAKSEVKVEDAIHERKLPQGIKLPKRKYYGCAIVKFVFRGIPQKAGQHYVFGGKANVEFYGYTLNSEQLELYNKKMQEDDISSAMKLVEGATTESLDEIKKDIDHFLNKEDEKEEKKKKNKDDVNPFSALFSGLWPKKSENKKENKKEINDVGEIKKDNYVEEIIRELAKADISATVFRIYDVYKKAHRMPSHDDPYE